MSMHVLSFERETLRNLAGPDLQMETLIAPLEGVVMEEINGGSILSAIASGILSAIGSAIVSGLASAVGTAVTDTPIVSDELPSAVLSAAGGASAGLGGSALYFYNY